MKRFAASSVLNRTPVAFVSLTSISLALQLLTRIAVAGDIEPANQAISTLLGTTRAFKRTIDNNSFFYSKSAAGAPEKLVFIKQGTYPPSCTHTWAVGLDAKTGAVIGVRPIEMSCPHAMPTKTESFLGQFKGRAPASAEKIETSVTTVAKATGSSQLAATAVKETLITYRGIKGKL